MAGPGKEERLGNKMVKARSLERERERCSIFGILKCTLIGSDGTIASSTAAEIPFSFKNNF